MRLLNIFGKKTRPGKLGIEVSPFGIAVAWVDSAKTDQSLGSCECKYIEGANLEENGRELKRYLNTAGLEQIETHVVLHPALYNIYLVDRPEVEDSELDEAVKWKIKDLVEMPLKDLLVDAFGLPSDAYRGSQKKVYAVTTVKKELENIVNIVKSAGAKLKTVSISELAVGNIVNLLHEDDAGAAILRMRNTGGTINLTHGGNLYLTRHIDSNISILENMDSPQHTLALDDMLLEIQRSLDYYDNQLGKGAIRNFLIAPTRVDHEFVNNYLQDHLGVNVHSLNLNEMFDLKEELSRELQTHCFSAIGAAYSEVVH